MATRGASRRCRKWIPTSTVRPAFLLLPLSRTARPHRAHIACLPASSATAGAYACAATTACQPAGAARRLLGSLVGARGGGGAPQAAAKCGAMPPAPPRMMPAPCAAPCAAMAPGGAAFAAEGCAIGFKTGEAAQQALYSPGAAQRRDRPSSARACTHHSAAAARARRRLPRRQAPPQRLPTCTHARLPASLLHPCAGGAQDAANFRENIAAGHLPLPSDVTYEGLIKDYYFDTSPTPPDGWVDAGCAGGRAGWSGGQAAADGRACRQKGRQAGPALPARV